MSNPWYRRKKGKSLQEGLKTLVGGLIGPMDTSGDHRTEDRVEDVDSSQIDTTGAALKKFSEAGDKVMLIQKVQRALTSIKSSGVDSEDIWPATAAWFLGPKAENLDLLQALIKKAIDEHAEFRRYKYFPLDPVYVTESIENHETFVRATEEMEENLGVLCQRLKNSVPFSNFRSQGLMLWDTTIASNVGYIAALLYNQNNVASMASGVTLQLEREVSEELCDMVGYNVGDHSHSTDNPRSWGHLPNGGTVANLEAMWAARSVKFNGLTLQRMMREHFSQSELECLQTVYNTFEYKTLSGESVKLKDANAWELLNIPVDEGIDLFDNLVDKMGEVQKEFGTEETASFDELFDWVKKYTLEELGGLSFFKMLEEELGAADVHQGGKWFCPGSRHYSWDKGANLLGIGRNNLVKIPLDLYCRMDTDKLREELQQCLENKWPVIGVTVVFGTTQEGAVDCLDKVLEIREEFNKKGLTFYIHIDGAWGGYFAAVIKDDPDGRRASDTPTSCEDKQVCSDFFNESQISDHFKRQLKLLKHSNSVTLDPHKSGFCPYPAGGLLYRNANIRKFLAQKADYVNHGTENNEEINLFGIDGSKPGAASAGVWLSHKVVGLHCDGYGLLLRQSSFSAGVMYALWVSLGRSSDPFLVVPGVPIKDEFKDVWTNKKIRNEILKSDNNDLRKNSKALNFIQECGPDTLINCVALNYRSWDGEKWVVNNSLSKQREFMEKFNKRTSHHFERPSMVDRGIQIILNSTSWDPESHSLVYTAMRNKLGLDQEDKGKLGVVINTCMTPWLRAQRTFLRMSTIIRNELYNAQGAMTDTPMQLNLVSPCTIDEDWADYIFAELKASFSDPSLRYHVIGRFMFNSICRSQIIDAAKEAKAQSGKDEVMHIKTSHKMTVFDLMTVSPELVNKALPVTPDTVDLPNFPVGSDDLHSGNRYSRTGQSTDTVTMKAKLEEYGDSHLTYGDIAMPEVEVIVRFGKNGEELEAKMKLKRVIRYHHLTRDHVDERDYPPTQEYLLYACHKHAYLSHCPNRYPDFQQLIQLDEIPNPIKQGADKEKSDLYQEALERGVVVYLPEISRGGKPELKKGTEDVCKDPIKRHGYNAISWSDQGAFTGDMTAISIKLFNNGKRWFDGTKINMGYKEVEDSLFGYLNNSDDMSDDDDETDEEQLEEDDEY